MIRLYRRNAGEDLILAASDELFLTSVHLTRANIVELIQLLTECQSGAAGLIDVTTDGMVDVAVPTER